MSLLHLHQARGLIAPGGGAPLLLIASAIAAGSVTVPAHENGDILIGFGFDDGNTVVTSVTDWTYIDTAGFSTSDVTAHHRTSDGTVSAFDSGMDLSAVVVLRPTGTVGVGGYTKESANDNSPTVPAVTLDNTDGTSHIVSCAFHRNNTSYAPSTATLLENSVTIGDRRAGVFHVADVAAWAGETMTASASAYWAAIAVEVKVS